MARSKKKPKTSEGKRGSELRLRRPPTAWHLPFGALVEERRPAWIEVGLEVLLQRESQRVDQVYTLHAKLPRDPDDHGRVMRGLWRHIPRVGIGEFKSLSGPLLPGDLYRLVACGWHWLARHPAFAPKDVALVLMLPSVTAALTSELAQCATALTLLGDGYSRASIHGLALVVVELDPVAEAEQDDWLRAFGHHPVQTTEVVQWLRRHTNLLENQMLDPKELVGHEDMIRKIAQSIPARYRLEGLSPEQREEILRELKPEERLHGLKPEELRRALSPEQALMALPDVVLRALPEDALAALPEDVQKPLRERLRSMKKTR